MDEVQRREITFEIMKVYIVKEKKREHVEIKVKVTDDNGSRITTIREGDVLKATFEGQLED